MTLSRVQLADVLVSTRKVPMSKTDKVWRSKAVCGLCGDLRVEEAEHACFLHYDLSYYEGWVFEEWGTVCGDCLREHETWSRDRVRKEVERRGTPTVPTPRDVDGAVEAGSRSRCVFCDRCSTCCRWGR